MRQLKYLDRWIRGQLYHYYFVVYKKRLPKKYFRKPIFGDKNSYLNMNIISLFKEACIIKSYYKEHPNLEFCECETYKPIDINDYA